MRSLFYLFSFLCLAALLCRADEAVLRPLDYAENFTFSEYPGYSLLTVRNAHRDAMQEYRYALVPRGQALPGDLPDDARVIRTPVRRVVLMETVYVGYLDALGQLDTIHGAATANYISHPEVVARLRSGAIESIQSGQKLNIERLLLLQPDLILTTSIGEGQDASPQLMRSGLPVVLTADYMERHPLARTEWLKFLAPFFECEARATETFHTIQEAYQALRAKTEGIGQRPEVFCGAPYSGVWHVPGGSSYIARIIRDAGGHYLWQDDASQGGVPLDTERVFLKAAGADIWLHPSFYRSLDQLYGTDLRFAKFRAAQIGQVYNNSRQVNPTGGNNIWERGIVHPEEVLADLIHIFHPELLPEYELIYYEQLQ
jgi:iron complex transport system substrate-binding protein